MREHSIPCRLFIYGLYNDIVSCTDCVASNGRLSGEQQIGRGAEGSCHSLISSIAPAFSRRDCIKP